MHPLVWSIWSDRGNEVYEQIQDEELALAGSPVAGLMAGDERPELAGKPVAGLKAGDEQLTGKPAAGLMEQIQDEEFAGYLAAGLAGTNAPARRAHQSFSQCKMTRFPNPNFAR